MHTSSARDKSIFQHSRLPWPMTVLGGPNYNNMSQVPVYGQETLRNVPPPRTHTSGERPTCPSPNVNQNSHKTPSTSSSSRSTTNTTLPLVSSTTENMKGV